MQCAPICLAVRQLSASSNRRRACSRLFLIIFCNLFLHCIARFLTMFGTRSHRIPDYRTIFRTRTQEAAIKVGNARAGGVTLGLRRMGPFPRTSPFFMRTLESMELVGGAPDSAARHCSLPLEAIPRISDALPQPTDGPRPVMRLERATQPRPLTRAASHEAG